MSPFIAWVIGGGLAFAIASVLLRPDVPEHYSVPALVAFSAGGSQVGLAFVLGYGATVVVRATGTA